MSSFARGNVFLAVSMLCSAGSQLLIKRVVDDARSSSAGSLALLDLLTPARMLPGGAGVLLMVTGFVFWLLCLTQLKLAYAYPVACGSVVFVTLFSAVFLHEAVTERIWLGTVLVVLGVVLIGPSR